MIALHSRRAGIALALLSAATFSMSGSFAPALIDAGWTPAAAVTVRVSVAALLLVVPAMASLRGQWHLLRRDPYTLLAYGVIAFAGAQLCYFYAVQHISVGVALLIEYTGVVLVVGWQWLRHGQRPSRLTAVGSVLALLGLALVLDLTGDVHLDAIGVVWAIAAAFGLAAYFVLSASISTYLPPLVIASAGMTTGAVALLALGALGAVPMHATFGVVELAGHQVSWLIPVVGLSVVAAAIAYVAGIAAVRALGARLASFVGLTEVLFAVLVAWLLLGELPTATQFAGGALIVVGVVLVHAGEAPEETSAERPAALGRSTSA